MARNSDPTTFGLVVAWTFGLGIAYGVLRADDAALGMAEEAVVAAQWGSNDFALAGSDFNLGTVLVRRDDPAERNRGRGADWSTPATFPYPQRAPSVVPVAALWVARESARRGERHAALPMMREAVDELHQAGRLGWEVWALDFWSRRLLEEAPPKTGRGRSADRPAGEPVVRLGLGDGRDHAAATACTWRPSAHRDDVAYRELVGRYRRWRNRLATRGTSIQPKPWSRDGRRRLRPQAIRPNRPRYALRRVNNGAFRW